MATFYQLAVKEIKRETPQAISVAFEVPLAYQDLYKFTAGQYVTLKTTLNGQELRRAYSICSTPFSNELRIAIKAVQNGIFSTYANKQLQPGDILEVSLPEGRFTFEPNNTAQKNYLGFAVGSGITPIMSILQTVLQQEPQSSFVLVYGNKSPQETIFHHQLEQLQQQYLGRLTIHYVFSQQQVTNQLYGRIDKHTVTTIFSKHTAQEYDKFYLCGPEEMITNITTALLEKGIKEKNIKFELFSATPASQTTQNQPHNNFEHTTVTVILDNEEQTFEMLPKQTLLEASLKQGLDAPYSCQGGVCSSCMARITSGSATMNKNSILTEKEIAEGLILTCQAHPTTAEITLNFDDV